MLSIIGHSAVELSWTEILNYHFSNADYHLIQTTPHPTVSISDILLYNINVIICPISLDYTQNLLWTQLLVCCPFWCHSTQDLCWELNCIRCDSSCCREYATVTLKNRIKHTVLGLKSPHKNSLLQMTCKRSDPEKQYGNIYCTME